VPGAHEGDDRTGEERQRAGGKGMKVYLAGGMRMEWRQKVKDTCGGLAYFQFLDPCEHGLKNADAYTLYDLLAIDKCDVLFGYMESGNPSGIGLAAEIGYAKAKGKIIILVDEKNDKYFDIVKECCNIVRSSFDEGIIILRSIERLY
jgi:nucleoside 2-deoxyribosyltransferase